MQDFAVEVLLYLDGTKEEQDREAVIRAALVASGNYEPKAVFADQFDSDEEVVAADDEVTYDYSAVQWESPKDVGVEEFERLEEMMRDSGISLSEDDALPATTAAFFDNNEDNGSAEWV